MNGAKLSGSDHTSTLAVLMAFISALLWGVWWIPIRWLNTQGLDAAWASLAMNAGAALAVLAWIILRRLPLRLDKRTVMGALLVGVAASTYSVAVNLSDVVRVILLFYLAPAWSKIIEWAFLGKGWGWVSTATVGLSLIGAYLVLGASLSLANFNAGDVLALLSGISWAVGATLVFTSKPAHAATLSFAAALSAAAISGAFLVFASGTFVTGEANPASIGMGAGLGAIYVLPILLLTMWSAQKLTPAVLTFLLTAEILSGVISSTLMLDEPFGLLQAIGAALILAAAAGEVVPHLRAKVQAS
ncbi:MAG: DMT family transporter [Roseovarius sp.]